MSINKNYVMAGAIATAFIAPLSNITDSHAAEMRVTTARVHFRTGEGTNHRSMGVLNKGTKVVYISENGNWTKVKYNSTTGYICSDYLREESSSTSTTTTDTMYVTPSVGLNVRKGPAIGYSRVGKLSKGTEVTVHSTSNGWSQITANGVSGYVSSAYLSSSKPATASQPAQTSAPASSSEEKTVSSDVAQYNSASASSIISLASQQIGKAYVWGAQGPNSFDCSGLTYYVYKNAGITLPRTSSAQSQYGTTVSKGSLQAGDLVFFDTSGPNNGVVTHAGIYIGNGQMIHASSSKGKIVQVSIQSSYWNKAFVTAKRVL